MDEDPPLVHPEIKTYRNWWRLSDDYRRRWREEEIREEAQKEAERPKMTFGFTRFNG
jgi:hypothetical protein